MAQVVFESVSKVFRHNPALFNLFGRERRGETAALKNVTFSVMAAEVVAILGPNGSGKTTALKLISTMLLPDAGSIRIDGFDLQHAASEVRSRVGIAVASERSFFPRLSARENLDFFSALDEIPRPERRQRIDQILQQVGLDDQADTLVMKFSAGMYQRLGLARALVKRPSVLLLDEPTRSLDAGSTEHLWSMVRALANQSATILLATHNFAEAAALATRALLLHRGQLVADRRLAAGETADDLRAGYFRLTSESCVRDTDSHGESETLTSRAGVSL